ncbi:hypothetical protein [Coralloluteibacterium thermophilus]|uniref:Secreted protein n=1 Tax=Coralloluteibacterium thermophilum TaxID=2707049 RepID=A0ABV9NHF2_9GAMM
MPAPLRVALALVLVACGSPAAAQSFSLQSRMSPEEFRAAGLDRLSEEERRNLDAWLRREFGQREETVRSEVLAEEREARRGLPERTSRAPIESTLPGTFRGIRAGQQFELENGQVWAQVEPTSLVTRELTDPRVVIRPGLVGTWYLRLEGYGTTFKVRRVR